MQECRFSKAGWPELCPVLWYIPGGFLTVMPRAKPLTIEEWENLQVLGWPGNGEYVIPVENKKDSFGTLNGKIVTVDYGT